MQNAKPALAGQRLIASRADGVDTAQKPDPLTDGAYAAQQRDS